MFHLQRAAASTTSSTQSSVVSDEKDDEEHTNSTTASISSTEKVYSKQASPSAILDVINSYLFPRCEFNSYFPYTTLFKMSEHSYWKTYFRSTPFWGGGARYGAKGLAGKTYWNEMINPDEAKRLYHNPLRFTAYQQALDNDPPERQARAGLYNAILQYRVSMCQELAKNLPFRRSIVQNNYPCIVVNINDILIWDCGESLKAPLSRIAVAYFVALVNKCAHAQRIPIELVIRSSFGHNLPSVDVLDTGFRINVGLVPYIYTWVIAYALNALPYMLAYVLRQQALPTQKSVEAVNRRTRKAPPKVVGVPDVSRGSGDESKASVEDSSMGESKPKKRTKQKVPLDEFDLNDNVETALSKTGDSGGGNYAKQITRHGDLITLLAGYATEALLNNRTSYSFPITAMLEGLIFDRSITFSFPGDKETKTPDKVPEFKWEKDDENANVAGDKRFWSLISRIFHTLRVEERFAAAGERLTGLYRLLDTANLNFTKESTAFSGEDGPGSDSEYEHKADTHTLYAKKLIVSTGMAAIGLANYVARLHLRNCGKDEHSTNCDRMYFEAKEFIRLAQKGKTFSHLSTQAKQAKQARQAKQTKQTKRAKQTEQTEQAEQESKTGSVNFLLHDLNYFDPMGEVSNVSLDEQLGLLAEDHSVVLLDYTSSITSDVSRAIHQAFTVDSVSLVLLVNSGLKNEQCGADFNPYGSLRIVTKDKKLRDDLYREAYRVLRKNVSDDENDLVGRTASLIFPARAHRIRKAYKFQGFVPCHRDLFMTAGTEIQSDTDDESDTQDRKSAADHPDDVWTKAFPDLKKDLAFLQRSYKKLRSANTLAEKETIVTKVCKKIWKIELKKDDKDDGNKDEERKNDKTGKNTARQKVTKTTKPR